jgi:hypothetical protein
MPELAHTQATLSNTFAEMCKYDSDHADTLAVPQSTRDRPVFGESRLVIDEIVLGQLSAVLRHTAHREPEVSLFEYYGVLPKIKKQLSREEYGTREGREILKLIQIVTPSLITVLKQLEAILNQRGEGSFVGPPGYGGPWFSVVHGDLHGGNIMVDSRSYVWLIDYGDVEDAHVFKDPAKLESCCWFIYTTLPIPPRALRSASARELRWWLSVPLPVAEQIVDWAKAHTDHITLEALPNILRGACAAAGTVGKGVDIDEAILRFASEAECDEYLREAEQMMDILLPHRSLDLMAASLHACPPFITKERLKLLWNQVTQIRNLLPQSYCQPHRTDCHPYDSHPLQYCMPLFYFALKMLTQYREPNPYSRRLAAHALEQMAGHMMVWVDGYSVDVPSLSQKPQLALQLQHLAVRSVSFSYGAGQRLCYVQGDSWHEGCVLRSPTTTEAAHLLKVYDASETHEEEVDLDAHSHRVLPLYAYAVGHPLRILSPRGAWEVCVVVDRAPFSNQFVVRLPPAGNLHWTALLPWNHATLALHERVPLFAVRPYEPAVWRSPDDVGNLDQQKMCYGTTGKQVSVPLAVAAACDGVDHDGGYRGHAFRGGGRGSGKIREAEGGSGGGDEGGALRGFCGGDGCTGGDVRNARHGIGSGRLRTAEKDGSEDCDSSSNFAGGLSLRKLSSSTDTADASLEKNDAEDRDMNAATQLEYGQTVEFVINIRVTVQSLRSWRALWCPGMASYGNSRAELRPWTNTDRSCPAVPCVIFRGRWWG